MASYTPSFKSWMVQRMAGPESITAYGLAMEVGVSVGTLSHWLRDAGTIGAMSKKSTAKGKRRTPEDKVRLVMEAEKIGDDELGSFLRREGIHSHQLKEWREKLMTAGLVALEGARRKMSELTPDARENGLLKIELRRKDRALAEAAALLVLKKNLEAYYLGDEADDTDTRSGT
ncbi:MAG: hypothetical protein V3W41_17585 [Planctomycetota bacterium]